MEKNIRIFMVGMSDHAGGVETYITNLCEELDKSKFEVIYNMPKMNIEGREWVRPSNRHNIVKYIMFWRKFFRDNKFDVVYYNTCDMVALDILKFAKEASVPVRIIHSHCANDTWELNFFQRLQEKNSKKNVDKYATHFFACSKEAGKWMFDDRKFVVIKNGIDYSKYQFNVQVRQECRLELLLTNERLIGVVGRLTKPKNPFYCIDVFEKTLEKDPNIKMVFIGDGEYRLALEQKVSEKGLKEKIYFLGIRSDVNKWMSAIDCLLMPSLFEGLPFTLVEAQAAGLHCVVSKNVPEEVNITGKVEFVNLEDDLALWAEKIIMECEAERTSKLEELTEAGYSIKDTAELVVKIIENALL